jgi:hypothetical protein
MEENEKPNTIIQAAPGTSEVRILHGEAPRALEYRKVNHSITHESLVTIAKYVLQKEASLTVDQPIDEIRKQLRRLEFPSPTTMGTPFLIAEKETGRVVFYVNSHTNQGEEWEAELHRSEALTLLQGLNAFDRSKTYNVEALRILLKKLIPYLRGGRATYNQLQQQLEDVQIEVKQNFTDQKTAKGEKTHQSQSKDATPLDVTIPLNAPIFVGDTTVDFDIELVYGEGASPSWTLECLELSVIEKERREAKLRLFEELASSCPVLYK